MGSSEIGNEEVASEALASLRARLDAVDGMILADIKQRSNVIRQIAKLKRTASIPMMQPSRVTFVIDRYGQFALENGLSVTVLRRVAQKLIHLACSLEDEVISPGADLSTIIATLGPAGTDHELATRQFSELLGLGHVPLSFFNNVHDAIDLLRSDARVLLVLNAAHPDADLLTTRPWRDGGRVAGAFLHDTQMLALVYRRSTRNPRSIAIMPSTRGYIDLSSWDTVVEVSSKPLAGEALLTDRVDAAIVSLPFFEIHRTELDLVETFGPVRCAWVVFVNCLELESVVERNT